MKTYTVNSENDNAHVNDNNYQRPTDTIMKNEYDSVAVSSRVKDDNSEKLNKDNSDHDASYMNDANMTSINKNSGDGGDNSWY